MNTLPRGWSVVDLNSLRAGGDHTFVGGPFGSDLTQKDYIADDGVPVIRGTNLGGQDSRFVDDGFVYVSDHKANLLSRNLAFPGDMVFTQRGTLGQVAIIPQTARFQRYVISQSQMKLTPDASRVDARFLYYYFRAPHTLDNLLSQTLATGVPHINLGILKRFSVPLPPLPEQRRIADVLDRAEALRAKRRAALAELDGLADAIFVDLFGDTVKNPRHWATVQIRDIGDIQGGLQVTTTRSMLPLEIPYLRVANVYRDRIDLTEVKSIRATESEVARTNLTFHDLLIVEGHGNPHEIGRCGLWTDEVSPCVHQNHIIRVRVDNKRVDPVFAWRYLNSTGGRRDLLRAAKTTSGLNTISVSNVKDASLWLPPLALQQEFARRVAAVEKLKAVQRASLAELDALFASLQDRAFRGAL